MDTKVKQHKYYLMNKEKIKRRQRKYYQLNRKIILAQRDNPLAKARAEAKRKIRTRIKYNRTWFNIRYRRLKNNAKLRGKAFDLSFGEFIAIKINKVCSYCGRTDEELITKDNIIKKEIMTIDRINNNKGYSKKNCIVACYDCNRIRGNRFSYGEMIIIGNLFHKIYKARK